MKTQHLAIMLTAVNLGLLLCVLTQNHPAMAQTPPAVPPVLRVGALEIVDNQGRVRASISVLEPSSRLARSTVVLRLIDPNGRPGVKIVASDQGAAVSLVGNSDTTQVLLQADGSNASLKLTNKDGKQQLVKP